MKSFLLIFFLAGCVSAQSLDDTLKYLNETLPVAGTLRIETLSFSIEEPNFSSCNASWVETILSSQRFSVPLGTVKAKASAYSTKPFGQIVLSGDITVKSVRYHDVTEIKARLLVVKDEAIAGKLVKAFTRAAELCRSKPDLF